MSKLNQIIAVEKGVKATAESTLTKAYHELQKVGPLSGIARTYQPRDDEGEQYPPESTKVQLRVETVLGEVSAALGRLLDVVITKDVGNQIARADIVVDGAIVAAKVPVTTLLTLEKKLVDLRTFVAKLPVLDPAEEWSFDTTTQAYRTAESKTIKTKKIPRNHVLAAPTDKHPAQVQMFTEDVLVGYWSTVKFSGAITQQRQDELFAKVSKLQEAVKVAREEANSVPVEDVRIGDAIFGYLGW